MIVPFADFSVMHGQIRSQLDAAIKRVLDSNYFIGGNEVESFETKFAEYTGAKYCVGCGNGLDAIQLILRAMGIGKGDEVIVPAHTYIATALAVTYVGATPVYVDVEPDYFSIDPAKLEASINEKTRAIILVHIYGQIGRYEEIARIAERHSIPIIEDAAQAHGAAYDSTRAGNLGVAAAFSFYPGKNLGAFGDAGAVTTNDPDIARMVRMIANYGSEEKYHHVVKGVNSRLDTVQAAILSVKLDYLERWNEERRRIASIYKNELGNMGVATPSINPRGVPIWHIFSAFVNNRNQFQANLSSRGIQTQIHYPFPMHLHEAYLDLGYKKGDFPVAEYVAEHELSLPMYYGMTEEQISYVIDSIRKAKEDEKING